MALETLFTNIKWPHGAKIRLSLSSNNITNQVLPLFESDQSVNFPAIGSIIRIQGFTAGYFAGSDTPAIIHIERLAGHVGGHPGLSYPSRGETQGGDWDATSQ
jgi:hypothetical protein